MLAALRGAFGRGAPFWREHSYNELSGAGECGYFSYRHSLTGGPDLSVLDAIIQCLFELAKQAFPESARACAAEWWAHCRPHACGHQLHYDADDADEGGAA